MGSKRPENKSITTRFARINPVLLKKKNVIIPVNKLICVLMIKLNNSERKKNIHVVKFAEKLIGKIKATIIIPGIEKNKKRKIPSPKACHRFHP